MTIDGRGRRVGKSVNGTRVKGWLYADQLRPIAELDGSGNLVSRFVYGTKPNVPEYIIKNGTTYRVFSDHLGSPRVIVDVTTGTVVQRMDFHAFGEIIQDSSPAWQPFGYVGGLYDPDTGLVRFGSRDYDNQSGRWLAKDSRRFMVVESNRYTYVKQDAVNKIDPTGEIGLPGAVIGGLTSLALQAADNYINNRDVTDFANYDYSDILVDAAVGAVAPSALGTLAKWAKAPAAIETITGQLDRAVSAARKAKLESRLSKYTDDISEAIAATAAWQFIKNSWKAMVEDLEAAEGGFCPMPQR
jgi:RHS repeat-associated protein